MFALSAGLIRTIVEDDKRVEIHGMDLSITEAVVLPDSPFGDHVRFGLPLNILLWIAATILIPVFCPLV